MYSLPITINNRREWIAELNASSIHAKKRHFVVEMSKTSYFNLVSIDAEAILKSFVPHGHDIPFNQLKATCSYDASNTCIQVTIFEEEQLKPMSNPSNGINPKKSFYDDLDDEEELNPIGSLPNEQLQREETELPNVSTDFDFQFTHHQHGMFLKAKLKHSVTEKLFDLDQIKIQLNYSHNQINYKSIFSLHLSHPSQFLGMALDFGSEASQMVVTRFGLKGHLLDNPANEDLFQKIKDYHLNKNWIENTNLAYYQEEKNTPFYKSIFFLKSNLGSAYENFAKEHYILEQNEHLKMLVDRSSSKNLSEQHYKQLPNLKITHRQDNILSNIKFQYHDKDENYNIDVKLNEISQKVSNTILKTMLESFLKKEFIQYKTQERFVRLILLVPNIYDSEQVQLTQNVLSEILKDIAMQDAYKNRLKAWEVVTISESDAAFVGYMSKSNVQVHANQDYVIIDAGKGTTDFSVIRTGQSNLFDVKPMYRNGFAGAGNLITNAIFETLIHFIKERNKNKTGVNQFIKRKLIDVLESDLAVRNDFFAELERLKFNFSTDLNYKSHWLMASSSSITFDKITEEGVTIFTIIELLRQIDKVADFYGYIQNVCEVISEKVVLQLEMVQQSASQIKLQGAVLTGRGFLFTPLANTMKTKLQERLKISPTNIIMLEGNELKDVCIKGVFNKSIRVNSELVGYPIQRFKSIPSGKAAPLPKLAEEKASKWWKKVFGSMDDYTQFKHEFVQQNALNQTQLQNSEIIIGSNNYIINEPDFFVTPTNQQIKTTIDYTSDGYKVRRHVGNQVEQIVSLEGVFAPDNPELHLIVPSLFPNYIDENYLASTQVDFPPDALGETNHEASKPSETTDLLFGISSIPKRDDLLF